MPADAAPFERLVQRLVCAAPELLGSFHCVDPPLQVDRAFRYPVLVDQRGELAQCQRLRAAHPLDGSAGRDRLVAADEERDSVDSAYTVLVGRDQRQVPLVNAALVPLDPSRAWRARTIRRAGRPASVSVTRCPSCSCHVWPGSSDVLQPRLLTGVENASFRRSC